MKYALSFLKGVLIGAGAIMPGLSGATLAVVFGVHEELTILVGHPITGLRAFVKRNPLLLIGAAIGFVAMSRIIVTFFAGYTTEILYLFSGFIAGTIPGLWRRGRATGAGAREYATFGIACAIMVALAIWTRMIDAPSVAPQGSVAGQASPAGTTAIFSPLWAVSGAIVGAGSLLPGISASFFLVFIGWYDDLISAVSVISIPALLQVGIGAALTLFFLSRITSWLYRTYLGMTSFAVVGITLGSLALIVPSPFETARLLLCAGLCALGGATSLIIDRVSS